MIEREMLELAAKAAGYTPTRVTNDGVVLMRGIRVNWKPMDDDGDAFRLAVALPSLDLKSVIADAWRATDDLVERRRFVRHAIVRFASEIGRLMP